MKFLTTFRESNVSEKFFLEIVKNQNPFYFGSSNLHEEGPFSSASLSIFWPIKQNVSQMCILQKKVDRLDFVDQELMHPPHF